MKRNGPEHVKARAELYQARLWLTILCKGIGNELADSYCTDNIRDIVDRINGELLDAVKACEVAERAYGPYTTRRVHHRRQNPRAIVESERVQ